MFIFSMSDGNAHLRNRWFYVWFWKQSSVWDPSPHFHMSHNKMQSPRSTQWAGNSSCWVNLQPIVIPFAAMLVAPKRFLSGRALQLMLQGYGEICRDSGPWISLCLFNSWLLFIHLLGYFFFFNNANVRREVPCFRFLLRIPREENMWWIFHDCIFNLHTGKLRRKFALQTIAGNKPPTYRDNKTSKGLWNMLAHAYMFKSAQKWKNWEHKTQVLFQLEY